MKLFLFSILLLIGFLSKSQTATLLGNQLSANVSYEDEYNIDFNNLGTPFVTFVNAVGDLKMKKLINGEWFDASSSLNTISSSVDKYDVSYNSTSDEFFIVYKREDSLFVRTYNGSWLSETYIGLAYSALIESCIDEVTNHAYFIYKESEYDGVIRKYNLSNGTIESISLPSDATQYLSNWNSVDLKFNPNDNKLYLSGNIFDVTATHLRRFDGSVWEQFSATIGQWNGATSSRILMDTAAQYDISVIISLNNGDGYTTSGKKFRNGLLGNYDNLQSPYIFDLYEYGIVRSFVKNNSNNHYAYLYTTRFEPDTARIRFTDQNSWHMFNHGFETESLVAINFRDNGKMLVAVIDVFHDLYIYEFSEYFASINKEDELDELIVHPNPTDDQLTISGLSDWKSIRLLDTKGNAVRLYSNKDISSNNLHLNQLESGVYFLNIITGNSSISKKVIIK